MRRAKGIHARSGEGTCLTERDLRIVRWLDGLGGASLDQVRRRFGLGRTQGYRRLQVLQAFGLVRRLNVLVGVPALYVARRRTVRPWAFEHTLLLADLVVDLELDGRTVLGEVAIRRHRIDGGDGIPALTAEQVGTIDGCGRIPDAVELRRDGEVTAYEIEIASKGSSRRAQILATYAASDYAGVEWIVPEVQLARLLVDNVTEMGLRDFMRVTHGQRIQLPLLTERVQQATTEESYP